MAQLPVTVFADFTCPFCYVTEGALRRLAREREGVEVRHRAFELHPGPGVAPSPADEAGWEAAVRPLAEALGLPLRVPAFRPASRKAHEAARFADGVGLGEALREAVYAAYWGEGRDIGRIDVLQELFAACGGDPTDLRIVLDIDRFRDDVQRDRELAARLRIASVPTLFVGTGPEARILIGAQTLAGLDAALGSH